MSEENPPAKRQKNLYLTNDATRLLALLAKAKGIPEASVVELMIRDEAKAAGLLLKD